MGRHLCEGEVEVATGQPHREILRVSRDRGADLVVVGIHRRRALDHRLLGTTLNHVVRQAPGPLLVVRPEERSVLS